MNLRTILILMAFVPQLLNANSGDDNELRDLKQQSFKRGEQLDFKVSYGIVDAARATLRITEESKSIKGRSTMHVVGTGKSLGAFAWFFKVEDRYETYMDEKAIVPWIFIRRVKEGGFKLQRNIYFNPIKKFAKVKNLKDNSVKKLDTEPNAQDLVSAFYYARTLDLQSGKKGDIFTVPTFFDYENYPMKVKFLGRDTVKTELGKFRCLKFSPLLQKGRVFKENEEMTIWISDDQNKVPIRLETSLLIGSLKMDLSSYKGLVAPLSEIKEED